ncbi:MAG: beta-lactamase family protein [Phycisphaera sp.]|nr:MAG: beta-lactamase family protein [Phycisphaera sp.]
MPVHPIARVVLVPLLVLALPMSAAARQANNPHADPDDNPARGALEAIRAQHGVPALTAYGVRWDGEAATSAGPWAVGDRAIGPGGPSGVPATTGDLWHIGSCTKAFTATLLATYVAEGKIRWTDTLREALPEVCEELGDELSEHAASATLAELVRHRAGLPANPDAALMRRLYVTERGEAREDVVRYAMEAGGEPPAEGEPGVYSNCGYIVAGAVCERLGGKPWEDLLAERVLLPLGIEREAFGFGAPPAGDDPASPTQPLGHRRAGNEWQAQPPNIAGDNPAAFGPAGTLHMTMEAWGRFALAHARGDDLEEGQRDAIGLSRENYAELHRPVGPPTFSAAAGWFVGQRPWARGEGGDGTVLTHSGSNTMWFAVVWVAPERDAALLSACNAAGQGGPAATDAAIGAALQAFRN